MARAKGVVEIEVDDTVPGLEVTSFLKEMGRKAIESGRFAGPDGPVKIICRSGRTMFFNTLEEMATQSWPQALVNESP